MGHRISMRHEVIPSIAIGFFSVIYRHVASSCLTGDSKELSSKLSTSGIKIDSKVGNAWKITTSNGLFYPLNQFHQK